jgi:hypothetical protein
MIEKKLWLEQAWAVLRYFVSYKWFIYIRALPVKIWCWNLVLRLRGQQRLQQRSFLVASEWGFKETLWTLGSGRVERLKELKFCGDLPWFNSGPRNFSQHDWSIGSTFISIFPNDVLYPSRKINGKLN